MSMVWRRSSLWLFVGSTVGLASPTIGGIEPLSGGEFRLYTHEDLQIAGLVGSFVDESLRPYAPQDDWRETQTISGTRIDETIDFTDSSWGARAEVGLTGGTDANWEDFSVQWDGFLEVVTDQLRLASISDDGSRMWIDIDGNGIFDSSGPEFLDNNWGSGQPATLGPSTVGLPSGVYRFRIQYEEGSGGNIMRLVSAALETLRVAYLIPSDRTAQPNGVANLANLISLLHGTCCEQMDRNGFGRKSFRFETDVDGKMPLVHTVALDETDEFLRVNIWGRVIEAATDAGVPTWNAFEVWLLVPEIHLQSSDGSISGGVALGASFGSGSDPGVAMIGSERLSLDTLMDLTDNRTYHGKVIPDIGPFPLVANVSFPWFEGSTISSVVSSIEGAMLHEASHAFGIGHDFRNDDNFHGNLMGNGLRGLRGNVFPTLYPQDEARLSYAAALALDTSRYFTSCNAGDYEEPRNDPTADPVTLTGMAVAPVSSSRPAGMPAPTTGNHDGQANSVNDTASPLMLETADRPTPSPTRFIGKGKPPAVVATGGNDRPTVVVSTSGAVIPESGQIKINFLAQDTGGLASALLRLSGDTAGEMRLSGNVAETAFSTPYYTPGQQNDYTITVYDVDGNRSDASTTILPAAGFNRAPRPHFTVKPSRVRIGEDTLLNASGTTDPNHPTFQLSVEWDLDGDEEFDTDPTTDHSLVAGFSEEGTRLIRVRVTDPEGAVSVSTPIAVRVIADVDADFNRNGRVDQMDFFVFHRCVTGPNDNALIAGCEEADLDKDGDADRADFAIFQSLFTGD